MKRGTLRNGIVVDCNDSYTVTVVSVPKKYHDEDGDDWIVGSIHELDINGKGGAWGKEYDVIKWHRASRPQKSKVVDKTSTNTSYTTALRERINRYFPKPRIKGAADNFIKSVQRLNAKHFA